MKNNPETRSEEWAGFSDIVHNHIVSYTIDQYGDKGVDLTSSMSKVDILKQIEKYVMRNTAGKNKRGHLEELRDCLKIAHYACMLFYKHDLSDEEIESLMKGK